MLNECKACDDEIKLEEDKVHRTKAIHSTLLPTPMHASSPIANHRHAVQAMELQLFILFLLKHNHFKMSIKN